MSDLQYVLREDGVHIISFRQQSRQAVVELFDKMHEIVDSVPEDGNILILVDTSNGIIPPLRHLFQGIRDFSRSYPRAASGITAVIHDNGMVVSILDAFLSTITQFIRGHNRVRFFPSDQRDRAEAWLASERKSASN